MLVLRKCTENRMSNDGNFTYEEELKEIAEIRKLLKEVRLIRKAINGED